MKKFISLEFSYEEAELLITVFSAYLQNVDVLQLRLSAIDIEFDEIDFVDESLVLLKDAVALGIDVILHCKTSVKQVLFSLALLTAHHATEENDHVNTSCMIKLLHGSRAGE